MKSTLPQLSRRPYPWSPPASRPPRAFLLRPPYAMAAFTADVWCACRPRNRALLHILVSKRGLEQPHTIYTFLFWEEFKKMADRWGL